MAVRIPNKRRRLVPERHSNGTDATLAYIRFSGRRDKLTILLC